MGQIRTIYATTLLHRAHNGVEVVVSQNLQVHNRLDLQQLKNVTQK